MEEKIGNINCKHKWVYDDIVIDTNPPIYHKVCSKCGRLEHEYGSAIEYSNVGGKVDTKIESFTGMSFQIQGAIPTKKLWDDTKREAIKYIEEHGDFPVRVGMPCKNELKFKTAKEIMDLPVEDIPCPCGDKTHWLARFVSFD